MSRALDRARVPGFLKAAARRLLARKGLVVTGRASPEHARGVVVLRQGTWDYHTKGPSTGRYYPADFEPEWIETIERVTPFTITTAERLAALCQATEYVVRAGIPGSFVECGVWRGGSMMAVALTLRRLGVADRDLYLFDTFSGMTRPTEEDVDPLAGVRYLDYWPFPAHGFDSVPLEEVEAALASTGYEPERLHFIPGRVEETLPDRAPSQIALLRLDTDWYESTLHELTHLYPRLGSGGVLIVDDYGHLAGARKATDEYLARKRILLDRIDYTGRIGVKQA